MTAFNQSDSAANKRGTIAVNSNGAARQAAAILKAASRGVSSVAKTHLLRRDRVSLEQYDLRLNVCRACPGGHATFKKDGSLHTCGPMLKSMAESGKKTCGCILNKKAWDSRERCPFGYWPTIESEAAKRPEMLRLPKPEMPVLPGILTSPSSIIKPEQSELTLPDHIRKKRVVLAANNASRIVDPTSDTIRSIDDNPLYGFHLPIDRRTFVIRSLASMTAATFSSKLIASGIVPEYIVLHPCNNEYLPNNGKYLVSCSYVNDRMPTEVFLATDDRFYKLNGGFLREPPGPNDIIVTPTDPPLFLKDCFCSTYYSCIPNTLPDPPYFILIEMFITCGDMDITDPETGNSYPAPFINYNDSCWEYAGQSIPFSEDDIVGWTQIPDCDDPICPPGGGGGPDPGGCRTLTSCSTGAQVVTTSSLSAGVISWMDDCWTVSGPHDCTAGVAVGVSGHSTVANCSDNSCVDDGKCYTLTNCNSETTIETNSNLKAFENMVILYDDECWIVSSGHDCEGTPEPISDFTVTAGCDDLAAGCSGNNCWRANSCDGPSFALLEGNLKIGDVVVLDSLDGPRCYIIEAREICPAGGDTNWSLVSGCDALVCQVPCDCPYGTALGENPGPSSLTVSIAGNMYSCVGDPEEEQWEQECSFSETITLTQDTAGACLWLPDDIALNDCPEGLTIGPIRLVTTESPNCYWEIGIIGSVINCLWVKEDGQTPIGTYFPADIGAGRVSCGPPDDADCYGGAYPGWIEITSLTVS